MCVSSKFLHFTSHLVPGFSLHNNIPIVKLKQFVVVVGVKLDGIPMCNGCTRTGSVEQRADVVGPPPRASTFS